MITEEFVPALGHAVKFQHRDTMVKRATLRSFRAVVPDTPLPIDCTGNAAVSCPIDGNNQWGDCGLAMVAHVDNILTFRQGKATQSTFDVNAIVSQYRSVSRGDNGLDEDQVVNQIWKRGIAGDPRAVCVDSLDIDVTDTKMARFAIEQFYAIEMAWSVPNAFINGFQTGSSWLSPMRPNPNHGHYTPLSDIDASGNYRLWTWGGWAWVSPSMVSSVEPQCFIAFSPRQFDPKTGLDSKGRHIVDQASMWSLCGGKAIDPLVIAAFPPKTGPSPSPIPIPVPRPDPPPGPVPTPTPPTPPVPVPPTPAPTSRQIIIDVDAQTVAVPAGFTVSATWGNVLKYWPNADQVGIPSDWTQVKNRGPSDQ